MNWVSRFAGRTPYSELADLTISMLEGTHGHQRKELDKLLKPFKNGEDLEKACRTLIDGRPELARLMMPQNGADYPSCIIFILILNIIIIIASKE